MDLEVLKREAESFQLPPSDWFSFWHTHLDWEGEGNVNPAVRRGCVEALLIMMRRIHEQLGTSLEHQTWVRIEIDDAGQDAVFVHTPNPETDFPCTFDDVRWGVSPHPDIAATPGLALAEVEIGLSDYEGAITYWLRTLEKAG